MLWMLGKGKDSMVANSNNILTPNGRGRIGAKGESRYDNN